MGAKPNAIALVLSKEKGKGEPDEDDDAPEAPSKEEVSALKSFDSATTPQERATALKQFIKLCGGY